MKFSVLHPSRRPSKWVDSWNSWNCGACNVQEHILAVDEDQADEFRRTIEDYRLPVKLVVCIGRCHDSTAAYNAAAKASSGDALIVSADDVFPPASWDSLMERVAPKDREEWVLHCSTGHPTRDDSTIFQPVFSRAVYERWGYVCWPEYAAMYADDDWTAKARAEGLVVEARHVLLEHRHPSFRAEWARGWDEVYEHEASQEHYRVGREVFARRKAAGFKP